MSGKVRPNSFKLNAAKALLYERADSGKTDDKAAAEERSADRLRSLFDALKEDS